MSPAYIADARPSNGRVDLLGRDSELASIGQLLDAGRGSLMLVGEPGIGKTALLHAAHGQALDREMTVHTADGVPAEATFPFAGLHQLLGPTLRSLNGLAARERSALEVVFGRSAGDRPDLRLVARAVISLVTADASGRTALLLADDVQWLDEPSAQVLALVARQTGGHRLIVIGAYRSQEQWAAREPYDRLPRLSVEGLSRSAAGELLGRHGAHLSVPARQSLQAEARGNPLALVELPSTWRLGTPPDASHGQALSTRLERAFAGRLPALPQVARDLLLVGAVDFATDITEIVAAASRMSPQRARPEDLDPAREAGLIHPDPEHLVFRHPLVRSAVLQAETVVRRQCAHAALAEILDADPYRRAWHRAQAIVGPDDEVADELAATVHQALARGAVMPAIASLRRAAQLTSSSSLRGHRLLMAAEQAFGLGRVDLVDELVSEAAGTDLEELDAARLQWLREIFNDGVPGDPVRVLELVDNALRADAADDQDLALNLLLGAALRCWWADTGAAARARVIEAADALPDVESDARLAAVLAVCEPVLMGRRVQDILARLDPDKVQDPERLRLLGMAAHAIGDEARAADYLDAAESMLRGQHRLGLLAHVLSMQVVIRLELGDWARAAEAAGEGLLLAEETGQPIWTTGTLVCEARANGLRGDPGHALRQAREAELTASRERLNDLLACVHVARGVAWLTLGRDRDAYATFRTMFRPGHPSYHHRERFDAVMFLAEAARSAGQLADAREVMAELEVVAGLTPSPLLHLQLSYARAVLADDDAEPLYRQALAQDLTRWPWIQARLQLAYGSWLAARGRHTSARAALADALANLSRLGARFWTLRAEDELNRLARNR